MKSPSMTHPQAPKRLDPPTPHQSYLSAVAASELVGTSGGYTLTMTPETLLPPSLAILQFPVRMMQKAQLQKHWQYAAETPSLCMDLIKLVYRIHLPCAQASLHQVSIYSCRHKSDTPIMNGLAMTVRISSISADPRCQFLMTRSWTLRTATLTRSRAVTAMSGSEYTCHLAG